MKKPEGILTKVMNFLLRGIWIMRADKMPPLKSTFLNLLRIMVLSVRGFLEDNCSIRASALTFYCILAIVPVIAMAFGIARGFGFDGLLRDQIMAAFAGQEEVGNWVMKFADSFLTHLKSGVVAGLGIAILFWTVINVLHHVELAMNAIWAISRSRTWMRKFADYLSFMLVCPVLLVVASAFTIYIGARLDSMSASGTVAQSVAPVVHIFLALVPFVLIWVLFWFIYKFMPNTKVHFRPAVIAAVVAGTMFQIMQWGYVKIQFLLSGYNAIYGSFAALPLFLIYLQVSWMIVLYGAELAFSMQNVQDFEFEPDYKHASRHFKRLVAVAIAHKAVKRFAACSAPMSSAEISQSLEIPVKLVNNIIDELIAAGILSEVLSNEGVGQHYQPACDIAHLTIASVGYRLDKVGRELSINDTPEIEKIRASLSEFENTISNAPSNIPLKDL